jgi:hypothetical protein
MRILNIFIVLQILVTIFLFFGFLERNEIVTTNFSNIIYAFDFYWALFSIPFFFISLILLMFISYRNNKNQNHFMFVFFIIILILLVLAFISFLFLNRYILYGEKIMLLY